MEAPPIDDRDELRDQEIDQCLNFRETNSALPRPLRFRSRDNHGTPTAVM